MSNRLLVWRFGMPRGVSLLSFALGLALLLGGTAAAREAPGSFAELAKRVGPAVVNISSTQWLAPDSEEIQSLISRDSTRKRPARPSARSRDTGNARHVLSLGSGFIIDPSGLIVTNDHVIEHAQSVKVTLADNTNLEGKIVGRDPRSDLALIRVKAPHPLPTVDWGNSDAAEVGDWVMVIGNPYGLGGSVTTGIVSARGRNIDAGPYGDYLQTDAAINRGNSGGPVFDMAGQVIGVSTVIFSPNGGSVGIGFATPASLARPIIEALRRDGKVVRGFMGVEIQELSPDLAEAMGMKGPFGALVADVTDKSPAADARIRSGDVITRINGTPIPDPKQLQRTVSSLPIGREAPITLLRDGHELTVAVRIARMPDKLDPTDSGSSDAPPVPHNASAIQGMTLVPTDAVKRDAATKPKSPGVMVLDVEPDSPAADVGIDPGDVLVEVDRKPATRVQEIASVFKAAARNGRKVLLQVVDRDGSRHFLALAPH
ncbi:MAG: Do family serine endopeptidase, partial [Alphaproteobacteria bacterium]|nr:Do family serine endopeptidase [Alphaproteobacteria bacterium]